MLSMLPHPLLVAVAFCPDSPSHSRQCFPCTAPFVFSWWFSCSLDPPSPNAATVEYQGCQKGPPFSHHFLGQIFQVLSYCQTSGLGGRDAAWWTKIWQNPWQSGLSKNQGCAPQVKRHFFAKMMFSDKATYRTTRLFCLPCQLSHFVYQDHRRIEAWFFSVRMTSSDPITSWPQSMSQKWMKREVLNAENHPPICEFEPSHLQEVDVGVLFVIGWKRKNAYWNLLVTSSHCQRGNLCDWRHLVIADGDQAAIRPRGVPRGPWQIAFSSIPKGWKKLGENWVHP